MIKALIKKIFGIKEKPHYKQIKINRLENNKYRKPSHELVESFKRLDKALSELDNGKK